MELILRVQQGIEVERQVFVGGIGYRAHGRRQNLAFAAQGANDARFHFNGIGPRRCMELFLFVCARDDTRAATETTGLRPGLLQKLRQITLIHYEHWAQDTWPNIDTLAACIQAVAKKEVQLMRKHIDQFTPPVLIQGYTGTGRAAVAWVNTILMKDIEKKDCFDIPDLIRKFMRYEFILRTL